MPSVRVRRNSQYTTLSGEDGTVPPRDNTGRPRSRTLASSFRIPGSTPYPSSPVERSNLAIRTGSEFATAERNLSADRPYNSVRLPSKVADSSLRATQALRGVRSHDHPYFQNRRLENNQDGTIALQGSQADIVVPNSGHPGVLESTLSFSSVASDPFRGSDDESLHEDDIVEHLDVIDPQIATVSNLANAANAILIPPIGVYSRKPVVVLPKIPTCEDAEKASMHEDDLDRHVEDVLSKRALIRRTLKGVWAFVKTPIGVVVALYGFCVVFWGAAIVLFLAKIINLHNPITQGFWVEVSSQIENALFTVTGVGLIPWRAIDTSRILRIWRFKRLTRKLRVKAELPVLYDEDDLPDPMYDPNYVHVLTDKQQKELHYQQQQFMKSQTWYRPHGTATHRAFPINTALLICLCNDGNSFFQCILCGTMWGLNRFQRPAWSTGILIPLSFLCGIASAVLIWHGGQKTKRTAEVEKRLRMALASERTKNSRDKLGNVGDAVMSRDLVISPTDDPGVYVSNGSSEPEEQATGSTVATSHDEHRSDDKDSSICIEENMDIPKVV